MATYALLFVCPDNIPGRDKNVTTSPHITRPGPALARSDRQGCRPIYTYQLVTNPTHLQSLLVSHLTT